MPPAAKYRRRQGLQYGFMSILILLFYAIIIVLVSYCTNCLLSIDPVFESDTSNVLEVFGVVCNHCHVESYGCTAYQQVKVIIQRRTEQTEANFLPLSRNTQMLVSSR